MNNWLLLLVRLDKTTVLGAIDLYHVLKKGL